MIIEYIRYRIEPQLQARFIEDYAKAFESLRRSQFCLTYELTKCEEDPTRFILRIGWTSTEDHLHRFRGSLEFREFLPHIRQYVPNIEEMQHYSSIGHEWSRA